MLSRFHLIPERCGRTDRRTTDRQNCYINFAQLISVVFESIDSFWQNNYFDKTIRSGNSHKRRWPVSWHLQIQSRAVQRRRRRDSRWRQLLQRYSAPGVITSLLLLHRVQKKRWCHWFFCCNFYKYWPIFFIIFRPQLHKRIPKSLAQKFLAIHLLCCYHTVWKSQTQK